MRIILFAIAVAAGLAILFGSLSTSMGGRPDGRPDPPRGDGTGQLHRSAAAATGDVIPGR